MYWLNEPPEWDLADGKLNVVTGSRTDFWRVTHYGFTRDSGHFYFQEINGDFTANVKFHGKYEALYDQAGLMVRLDERNWMKCGVEFVDGVQQASVVVTRDYSDWSMVPLAKNHDTIWLRINRRADTLEIHYSMDGQKYTMLRMAYFSPTEAARVGMMCASPDGPGFSVLFDDYSISKTLE